MKQVSIWLAAGAAFLTFWAGFALHAALTPNAPAVALEQSPKPLAAVSAQPTAQAPATSPEATAKTLDFGHLLGVQIAYVESKIGPAREIVNSSRNYRIGTCDFSLKDEKGAVASITVPNTNACAPERDVVLKSVGLPTGKIKFSTFIKVKGPTSFQSDCLSLCGNAADPWLYLSGGGSHSENWIEVRMGVAQVSGAALEASDKIQTSMRAEGPDYVSDTKFNCDRKYDQVAEKAMAPLIVESIEVGYDLSIKCN